MPTGETEILNYLASGVVRGIGPATAQKLVDRFGADTLDVARRRAGEAQDHQGHHRQARAGDRGELARACRVCGACWTS